DVTLLSTSRERLNLQEEWAYDVQGLAFPTATDEDRRDSGEYSALEREALFKVENGHPLRPDGDARHLRHQVPGLCKPGAALLRAKVALRRRCIFGSDAVNGGHCGDAADQ